MKSSSYLSQQMTVASLSIFEKLDTALALFTVCANAILAVFSSFFQPTGRKPRTIFKHIALTALRTITQRASVRQQHYLAPPTDDAYEVACKNRSFKPDSEILEDGTQAHWIGSRKAEKLILNFHGGGYVFPAPPEHFEFMFQIVEDCNSIGKTVACLFLSYDLAPGGFYPRQLHQAAILLNHVLNNLLISPSNILITGSSAGANLALALLSHISHPHSSSTILIPPISLSIPLAGVILISPWVTFSTSSTSFVTNAYRDFIRPEACKQWSTAFMNTPWPHITNTDPYNQPLTASKSWWHNLQVERVVIVAGEDEAFIDDIRLFSQTLIDVGDVKVEVAFSEGEFHDQPNVDLQLGFKESQQGEMAKVVKMWVKSMTEIRRG